MCFLISAVKICLLKIGLTCCGAIDELSQSSHRRDLAELHHARSAAGTWRSGKKFPSQFLPLRSNITGRLTNEGEFNLFPRNRPILFVHTSKPCRQPPAPAERAIVSSELPCHTELSVHAEYTVDAYLCIPTVHYLGNFSSPYSIVVLQYNTTSYRT